MIRFTEGTTNTVTCDDRTIFQTAEGIWVSEKPVSKKLFKAISAIPKWNATDTPDLHQMLEVSTNYLIYNFNNILSLIQSEVPNVDSKIDSN